MIDINIIKDFPNNEVGMHYLINNDYDKEVLTSIYKDRQLVSKDELIKYFNKKRA